MAVRLWRDEFVTLYLLVYKSFDGALADVRVLGNGCRGSIWDCR